MNESNIKTKTKINKSVVDTFKKDKFQNELVLMSILIEESMNSSITESLNKFS